MNHPTISVIIPVYNVEKYLRECLDSVVNQTFRDIEIICINDGSTDGSLTILEEFASKDNRIRIISQKNEGQGEAKNVGISAATGDYIQFVDSDDYLDLNACQTIYSKAVETNSDMVMFLFQCFGAFEKRSSENVKYFPSELTVDSEKVRYEFNNMQTAWSNLFLRSFIEQNKILFHKGLLYDDVPFVIKASLLANKIAIVPHPLYFYRQRDDSIMGDNKKTNYLFRPQSFQVTFEDVMPLAPDRDSLSCILYFKYSILYHLYYKINDKKLRLKLGHNITQSITDSERKFMIANEKSFESKIFSFFVKYSGLTFYRWKYNCKRTKGNCFDWLAKRLIPYSPWLQHTLEIVDRQREQIQKLQKELENSQDE